MLLPSLLKFAENRLNLSWGLGTSRPGTSLAEWDNEFYPTDELTRYERRQAMALLAELNLPEGSIFVMEPDKPDPKAFFKVVPDPDPEEPEEEGKTARDLSKLGGISRGAKIVELLKKEKHDDFDTVVITGNASSPLGSAALGKMVAKLYTTKVASIVAGQGAVDWAMESSSGMLLSPMANMLNTFDTFDPMFERLAQAFGTSGVDLYVRGFVDAMPDAGTLYALLKARLLEGQFEKLNMIVSHSKGNWAVLAALLAFELELENTEKKPRWPIDVVTFGNPVHLPDMKTKKMKNFFTYFQFVGEVDLLAHFNSLGPWGRTWMLHVPSSMLEKLQATGAEKLLDPEDPRFDRSNADETGLLELMVARTGHRLSKCAGDDLKLCSGLMMVERGACRMPIEKILPQIRPRPPEK